MIMSALNSIRELIALMKTEEIKVARDFLTSFSTRGKDSKNLSLELFDYLLKEHKSGKVYSSDEIEFFVYGNYDETGFPLLIIRLLEKLEESLLLSINLNRKDAYSEKGLALYQIRKKLSAANLIFNRGAKNHAIALFKYCIKQSEKFEYYEELANATKYYSHILLFQNSIREHEKIKIKNDKAIRAIQAVKKAEYYYNLLIVNTEFNTNSIDLMQLERQIKELQFELAQTGSAQVGFYLYFLETQYYQQKRQFKAAASTLKEQLNYIQHPAIFSPNTHSLVLLNIAWNELFRHRFNSANTKAKALIEDKKQHTYLFKYQANQIIFYSNFYLGNIAQALDILEFMDGSDNSETIDGFRKGKRSYLKAAIFFIAKDYTSANNILRELNPIEEDDLGWNVHLRILYILNDIERGEHENAFNRIENMRKHLEKNNRKKEITKRVLLIYEILKTLANSGFDFISTKNKKRDDFALFNTPEYEWEVLSPEMIIFHHWFEQKQYKHSYKFIAPEYKEINQTA
jgi:hypothetical protein